MSTPARTPARIATGDWVVVARSDADALAFLGKITDGTWDPRDDALLSARVETAAGTHWFPTADLERVSPVDEADLAEAALARGLVPPERVTGLRADVEAVRGRTLGFVRSPGLLDRLWAALPTDGTRSNGLAAFFDHGRAVLRDQRDARWAPLPVAAQPAPIEESGGPAPRPRPPRPRPIEPRPRPAPAPARAPFDPSLLPPLTGLTRPAGLTDVVARILGSLPLSQRRGFARDLGASVPPSLETPDLAKRVVASGVGIDDVLDALTRTEIARAAAACALGDVGPAELRTAFRSLAAVAPDEGPTKSPRKPRRKAPAAPAKGGDPYERFLQGLNHQALFAASQAAGLAFVPPLAAVRAKLRKVAPEVVVGGLEAGALRHAARKALGLALGELELPALRSAVLQALAAS